MNNPGVELPRHHANTLAFIVHDEIKGEMLDEKLRILFDRLAI